jgi:hypothetical protein
MSNASEMYTTAANYASTAMTLVCMHSLLQVLTVYWQFILPKHVMATAASNEEPAADRANPLLDAGVRVLCSATLAQDVGCTWH